MHRRQRHHLELEARLIDLAIDCDAAAAMEATASATLAAIAPIHHSATITRDRLSSEIPCTSETLR
jgi:hypothetical protein